MKKADRILIISVLILALVMWGISGMLKKQGATVVISFNGVEYTRLPLDVDKVLTFSCEYGTNTIEIKDGTVFVSSADCKDKYCVLCHPISRSGESIICLPHKLIVSISSDNTPEVSKDAVQIDQFSR